MIVEYKMHRNNNGNKFTPTFIEDWWYFNIWDKFVGKTVTDWSYIPKTLIELTEQDLIDRLTWMNMKDIDWNPLDEDAIKLIVDNFIK